MRLHGNNKINEFHRKSFITLMFIFCCCYDFVIFSFIFHFNGNQDSIYQLLMILAARFELKSGVK